MHRRNAHSHQALFPVPGSGLLLAHRMESQLKVQHACFLAGGLAAVCASGCAGGRWQGACNVQRARQGLRERARDPEFQAKWREVKRAAKAKAMAKVCELTGGAGTAGALLDVQVTGRPAAPTTEVCCVMEGCACGPAAPLGAVMEEVLGVTARGLSDCCWAGEAGPSHKVSICKIVMPSSSQSCCCATNMRCARCSA